MFSVGPARIFLYSSPVDMRKSFEGLSGLINNQYPGKLLSGSLFVFVNKRRTLLKLLYWDGDGFAIWYKRLEKGTFSSFYSSRNELTRREFSMLLEGVVPRRMNSRFSLEKKQEKR